MYPSKDPYLALVLRYAVPTIQLPISCNLAAMLHHASFANQLRNRHTPCVPYSYLGTYSMKFSCYYGTGNYNLPCLMVLELVP